MTVGSAATTSQGTVDALKVYDMFKPPSGTTNQRPPEKQVQYSITLISKQ